MSYIWVGFKKKVGGEWIDSFMSVERSAEHSQLATREGSLRKWKLGKGTTTTMEVPSDKGFK